MTKRPYQDQWRDGQLVRKGRRDCEGRYHAMAELLAGAATVADIGGWDGYFSRRIAEDHDVAVTLVEQRNVPDLARTGIVHRKMTLDASNVDTLGHHDVILTLAVLHHMPDWEQVYNRLRAQCDLLIVEAAHPQEAAAGRPLTPTLTATRPQIGPSYDRATRDGDVFHITSGPNGVDRPMVAIRNTLTGVVEDGSGRARPYMQEQAEDFWGPLGYLPHPGTLNVRVGRAGRQWASLLPAAVERSTEKLPGPYWPVTVGDAVDGHVRLSRSKVTVEVVAPVPLRETLKLSNGDTVEIRPR